MPVIQDYYKVYTRCDSLFSVALIKCPWQVNLIKKLHSLSSYFGGQKPKSEILMVQPLVIVQQSMASWQEHEKESSHCDSGTQGPVLMKTRSQEISGSNRKAILVLSERESSMTQGAPLPSLTSKRCHPYSHCCTGIKPPAHKPLADTTISKPCRAIPQFLPIVVHPSCSLCDQKQKSIPRS